MSTKLLKIPAIIMRNDGVYPYYYVEQLQVGLYFLKVFDESKNRKEKIAYFTDASQPSKYLLLTLETFKEVWYLFFLRNLLQVLKMDKLEQSTSLFVDDKKRNHFIKGIRRWGRDHYQHYPWREEKNLYRILVTEICLQKTDSQKVNRLYYLIRQLDSPKDIFENIEMLDEIVARIGLSYKRDRILKTSLQLVALFDGNVPGNYKDLRSLYGVGDYIANAVLSFGFKKKTPLVDTNTIRIVESYFGYYSPKIRPREDRYINDILLTALPSRSYVLFNYYLLDFGALQCIHSKKFCTCCILKRKCNYFIINSK